MRLSPTVNFWIFCSNNCIEQLFSYKFDGGIPFKKVSLIKNSVIEKKKPNIHTASEAYKIASNEPVESDMLMLNIYLVKFQSDSGNVKSRSEFQRNKWIHIINNSTITTAITYQWLIAIWAILVVIIIIFDCHY